MVRIENVLLFITFDKRVLSLDDLLFLLRENRE
jgi:hypothetical protein